MLNNLLGVMTGLALVVGAGPTASDVTFAGDTHAAYAKSKQKKAKQKQPKQKQHGHAVAGSFAVVHSGPPSVTPVAPDLCIIELSPSFVFANDLEGSFTSPFVIEHAGPCDQPAPEYFSTDGVWTGSVLGAEGSFAYSFEGAIDSEGIATGVFEIIEKSGTGALASLEGSLTLTGLAGVEGTYSGTLDL